MDLPSESQFADDYLPVFRWADASTDMHTRVGGGDQMDNIRAMSKSEVAGSFITAGNFFFTLVTGLTKIAIEFTPLDSAGKSVDEAFAKLGEAIIDSPILGLIIVICLIVGLVVAVRQTHGKPIVKTLAKPLILIAIFSVMVSGATASTDSKPGSFSRGGSATPSTTSSPKSPHSRPSLCRRQTWDSSSNSTPRRADLMIRWRVRRTCPT